MKIFFLAAILTGAITVASAAGGNALVADLDLVALRDDFDSTDAWHAQPAWLANASSAARVIADAGVACFSVPEPNRGMKWSRQTPAVHVGEMRYLVIRYCAENVRTQGADYFLHLDDGGKTGQCTALRMDDVIADGQWHTAAVDAQRLAATPEIKAVAIQLQATATGNAWLWVDWLMFADRLPQGAIELHAAPQPPAAPDWFAPLASVTWMPQASWLSNPCQKPEASREPDATMWRVTEPARGMKWSCALPERVNLEGHRYLALHYRATNCQPWGDYALCVIGRSKGKGHDYLPVIAGRDIISDSRWHTLTADLGRASAQFSDISAFAVQVQAGASVPAELRVDRLALTNRRPQSALAEFLDVSAGSDFAGFLAADISGLCNLDSARLAKRLNIAPWTGGGALTAQGVPFKLLSKKPDLYGSTFEGQQELAIPVSAKASEVYLLLWAAFVGDEEPSRGAGKLRRIADVDRFRVRLEYADGSRTECLPLNAATRRFEINEGPQVLCAFAEPGRELRKIVVRDLTTQGVFGVAAVTCRTAKTRIFGQSAEETPALRVKQIAKRRVIQAPAARVERNRLELSNSHLTLTMELAPSLRIARLVNRVAAHDCMAGRESEPLLTLRLDGKALAPDALKLAGEPQVTNSPGRVVAELRYDVAAAPGLQASVRVELSAEAEIAFEIGFQNGRAQPVRLGFAGPNVGAFCVGRDLGWNYYLFPKHGAAFSNAPANYRARYCGHDFPLQFLSVVNPDAGEGVSLRTEDTGNVWRTYCLRKTGQGVSVGLDYPDALLAPDANREGVRTVIAITGGDWREGFEAYRRWLRTWYRPTAPRQPWFREVFNFRQRFLWSQDPLYDRQTGEFQLERSVTEAKEKFGGIEYLHLFDWGYCGKFGRIYGRTGDHSPYDYLKGGKDALRQAIAGVQAQGVRTGLYIEGYLLDERGRLGQAHGKEWQLIRADGTRAYWPESTEMFICPWVPAWREVQASTYATKVRELNVDGMYLDEFGFSDAGKDCYNAAHGHPVPGYAVQGERGCARLVRDRMDAVQRGVALYSEECPCDVNSQDQDGSFTYSMSAAARTDTLAPLNLLRFAIPSFKTFEILYCDKPTGTWATGVKWVFFNGEGIWLEGPADEWFAPDTLATIRKCHAILRQHKDTFTSDDPVPLVPTEAGGVFANLFPAGGKRVYTLYNARHRTFAGDVLRLPHVAGTRYYDAWNERSIEPRRDGNDDVLVVEIEPQGVGCVVVTAAKPAQAAIRPAGTPCQLDVTPILSNWQRLR